MTQSPGEYKPSRRDVLRPVEYIGGAAIAAIFTGVVTLVVTRDLTLALIGTGGAPVDGDDADHDDADDGDAPEGPPAPPRGH